MTMIFFDLTLSTTLTCYITVHRAGSQLKTQKKEILNVFALCLCSIVKLPIEMAGCQFDRRQYFLPILTNYRTRGQIILITPSSFLLRMPGFTVRKIGYSDSTLPILTATATNVYRYVFGCFKMVLCHN